MKILLAVAQELGPNVPNARLQQLLFLYCTEAVKRDDYYEFIPSNAGPFSLQAEEDKRYLIHKKYLEDAASWIAAAGKPRFAVDLDFFEKIAIQDLKNQWLSKPDEAITQHINEAYPYYSLSQPRPHSQETVFYTIGYEGVTPEGYINALIRKDVRLLCDVRKNPISKKYGFSRNELSEALSKVGIEYLHIPELGIVSEKRQKLETDSDYEALFKEYEETTLKSQTTKIDQLQRLLEEKQRIAITCFEADVYHCHRSRVTKALKAKEHFSHRIEHLNPCNHSSHSQNVRKSSSL